MRPLVKAIIEFYDRRDKAPFEMQNAVSLIGFDELKSVVKKIRSWWVPLFAPKTDCIQLSDEQWATDLRSLLLHDPEFAALFKIERNELRFSDLVSERERRQIIADVIQGVRQRMTISWSPEKIQEDAKKFARERRIQCQMEDILRELHSQQILVRELSASSKLKRHFACVYGVKKPVPRNWLQTQKSFDALTWSYRFRRFEVEKAAWGLSGCAQKLELIEDLQISNVNLLQEILLRHTDDLSLFIHSFKIDKFPLVADQ